MPATGQPRVVRPAALWGRASARLARLPVWLKLAGAAACLTLAGLAVIEGAGLAVLQSYLNQRVDREVQASANLMAASPFIVGPDGPALPTVDGVSIEVLDLDGRPLVPVVPGEGPAIRPNVGWIDRHAGRPLTLAGERGRGQWRVLLVPVRYETRHLPFVYAEGDWAVAVHAPRTAGLPGTLVVGYGLGGIDHQFTKLIQLAIGIAAAFVVLIIGLAVALSRLRISRPGEVDDLERAAEAGELSHRLRLQQPSPEMGRIAQSVNTMLGRAEDALRGRRAVEESLHTSREGLSESLAGTAKAVRQPVSIIAGLIESYRRRAPLPPGEVDRMMHRVQAETAKIATILGGLPERPARPAESIASDVDGVAAAASSMDHDRVS